MKKRIQTPLQIAVLARILGLSLCLLVTVGASTASAADAARGAYLYLQTDNGLRSCVSCHGPGPGQNRNNLLRAADQPTALTRALSTVGVMGYLGSELSDADRANVSAFLGSVLRLNAPDSALRVWPISLEFGQLAVGARSATQSLRLSNPSSSRAVALEPPRATDASLLVTHDCPASLPPLAFSEVKVALKPTSQGPIRAAVEIGTSTFTSPVVVGVLAWQPAVATARFEASSLEPVRRVIPLFNPGPLPAVIGVNSLVGPGASNFRIEGGCAAGSVLLAGTTCDVAVGPPKRQLFDPVLLLAVLAAAMAAAARGRRRT